MVNSWLAILDYGILIRARGVYPYLFIAPIIIGMGVFGFYCAYEIFRLSLFESSLLSERYVGLDNYFYIFKEKWFMVAISHTLYYPCADVAQLVEQLIRNQ